MQTTQAAAGSAAFKQRIRAARVGDLEAQYDVGLMYAKGDGVSRDLSEAMVWFKTAAQKGHANAQYILGTAYASGVGTEKDEFEAVQWTFKAAHQGNEKALLTLARRIGADHQAIAFLCCTRAAAQGVADAQFMVAQAYSHGAHVPRDEQKAREWHTKA